MFYEPFPLFYPLPGDELRRGEAFECLEAPGEVVSSDRGYPERQIRPDQHPQCSSVTAERTCLSSQITAGSHRHKLGSPHLTQAREASSLLRKDKVFGA